ncbi:uncharacterized protein LOC135695789, partial [Rhopilema esculentum]|uniref:uncharacterized protein LOC135695789 n=1 Tax=Rhopilema esculentum TaxID=499914 RepID=UPI0031E34C59
MEDIAETVLVFQRILANLVEIQRIPVAEELMSEILGISLETENKLQEVCRRVDFPYRFQEEPRIRYNVSLPGPERKKKRAETSAAQGEYRAVYEQGESSTSIEGPSNAEDVATLGEISLDVDLQEELEVTQTEGLINSFTLDESSQDVGSEQLLANLQIEGSIQSASSEASFPATQSGCKGARSAFIGHHSSNQSRYEDLLTHSAFPDGDCKHVRTFVGNNSSYVLPPPSSKDNIFQLDLPYYGCADVVLIPEGIDLSNHSWDEENNAELDVLIAALNYSHAVRNRIFWQVGRFLVHSSSCLGTSRDEVALRLGKRVFQKRQEEYEQLLRSCGCNMCLRAVPGPHSRGNHCCQVDSRARLINIRYANTSTRSLQRMLRLAEGLGPTPDLLRFFNVTLPIGFFATAVEDCLPACLKNIAIGSFLDVPSYLLYDFPLVEDGRWVKVPLDVCFFPDADGITIDRYERNDFVAVFSAPSVRFRLEGLDAPEMDTSVKYTEGASGQHDLCWDC